MCEVFTCKHRLLWVIKAQFRIELNWAFKIMLVLLCLLLLGWLRLSFKLCKEEYTITLY